MTANMQVLVMHVAEIQNPVAILLVMTTMTAIVNILGGFLLMHILSA